MTQRPTLTTPRLLLRPFELSDAPAVQRLAGAPEIAATTANVPHPYEDGMAEAWIGGHQLRFEQGQCVDFAMVVQETGELCGAMSLSLNQPHARAELGYWIGLPFWNRGYCTEAAHAVVGYGCQTLGLHRIAACHMAANPASGRVMQKIGMTREGAFREHLFKDGQYRDIVYYGLLAREYREAQDAAQLQPDSVYSGAA